MLDFGCLEHVFDFPVAWRNCVALCRVGGHLLHSLPANNLSGHGFYQFSPELFFNLYQAKNGFELLGLWFALKADPRHWWKVADPAAVRRRVTLRNAHEVYMLVLARKLARGRAAAAAAAIGLCAGRVAEGRRRRRRSAAVRAARRGRWPRSACSTPRALARERLRALRESGLALPAPDYQRVDVAELLRRAGATMTTHDAAPDPRPAAVREPGAARRRRALRLRARRCARRRAA